MQTYTYIDANTREAVRAQAIEYIASDVPQGRRLDEYARTVSERTRHSAFVLRRLSRRSGSSSSLETTTGDW